MSVRKANPHALNVFLIFYKRIQKHFSFNIFFNYAAIYFYFIFHPFFSFNILKPQLNITSHVLCSIFDQTLIHFLSFKHFSFFSILKR